MASKFGDLIVRVGADISGFKDAFKDAIELLDTAGDRATRAGAAINKAFEKLGVGDAAAKVAAQAKSLQSSFETLEKAYKDGKISADDFAKAQEGLRVSLQKLTEVPVEAFAEKLKKLGSLGDSFKSLGQTLSFSLTAPLVAFTGAAVKVAADMESLKIGLKTVTKEAGPLEVQLARLKEVAKLPGLSFKEAVQGSINLQAAGFSANTAERALKSFGNALVSVGKGKEELQGVFLALSQIASKGKVFAQEINQLAERLPQIRVAMKDAFGTANTEELAKMGVSSEEFVEKIIKQFERLPQATGGFKNDMENLRDSFEQSMAAIGNALLPFARSALEAIQPVVAGIKSAAEAFAQLPQPIQTGVVAIAALAAAVGPTLFAVGSMAKTLAEVGPLLSGLASAGAPAGQALTAASAGAGLFAAGLIAVGAAIAGLSLYEVVKGATEVGSTLFYLAENSKKTETELTGVGKALEQVGGFIESLIKKTRTLTDVADEHLWNALWPPAGIRRAFQDLDIDIQRLINRFPDLEKAAHKGQDAVNAIARAQADGAMRSTAEEVAKRIAAADKQRQADLKELEIAEQTLKTLKKMKASKDELRVATEAVTAAQRKLHPEFVATGNAAGAYADKLEKAKHKAVDFNKKQLEFLAAIRKEQQELNFAQSKYQEWEFRLITGGFDEDVAKLIEGVDKVQWKLRGLIPPSKEAADALDHIFKDATKDLRKLDEAYKETGQKTLYELKTDAEKAAAAFELIKQNADRGIGGTVVVLKAQADALKAQIEYAKASGEPWKNLQRDLDKVNGELEKQGVKVKGAKESWADFSKEVSTIITNFSQDVGKTLFDGTKDWGAKFTKLWRDLRGAVVSVFITPITTALTKFVTTTLTDLIGGKGFGGLHQSILNVGDALKRVFGGTSAAKSATDAAKGATDAAKGVTDATKATGNLSSVGNLTNLVSAVSGVVSAISSVISNFQFAAMNKSLDLIVKHTLEIVNEMRNLRADSWTRENNLFLKIDDLWRTILEVKDCLGNQIITALESSDATLKTILTAIESGSFGSREVADAIEAPLPVLERIISAITDGTTSIVAAIREFGISGGGTGPGAAGVASGRLSELQYKLIDMLEAQQNTIKDLPEEMKAALKAGELPGPATEEQRAKIAEYYLLHDMIVALRDEIARLNPSGTTEAAPKSTSAPRSGTSSGAIDPETVAFDPNQLRTTVVAVGGGGGGGDMTGVVGAITSLHEMIASNWAALFELMGGGPGLGKVLKKEPNAALQTATEEVVDNTADLVVAAKNTTEAIWSTGQNFEQASAVLGSDIRSTLAEVSQQMAESASSLGDSIIERFVGGGMFDYANLRNPAPVSIIPDMANPRSLAGVSPLGRDAGRPVQVNIYGNIRNRSDVDYLVNELELSGVRI